MVHIDNGILLSHKRSTFESVLMRWMNPGQSEVSQKEKDKYHTVMHIYGIWKNGNDFFFFFGSTAMEKQT